MKYTHVVASLLVAGAVALAGCSSSGTSDTPSHNQADVTFATDMIPHHRQAVQMAGLAATRADDPRVTRLATEIENAQQPEITRMSGWLTEWGKNVPSDSPNGIDHGSMDHGSGMMSAGEMAALGRARGPRFDRLWTTMMIAHHQGAVTMSRTELADGRFAAGKTLATSILRSQSAQITTMKSLLASLPAA